MLERGAPRIDTDTPCANCGYNIRGLNAGRACPECGKTIPLNYQTASDPLLSGDQSRRMITLWGLSLMTAAAAGFAVIRIVYAVVWSLTAWPPPIAYFSFATVLALAWCIGVWMGTPPSLNVRHRAHAPLRWLARLTQLLWLPVIGIPLIAMLRGTWMMNRNEIAFVCGVLMAVAGLGWLVLAFVMHQTAEDLELDEAPRRVGMAIWAVPVLSALLLFVPLTMYFFTLALLAPFMLFWGWYLIGFARGIWEMRQYVAWGCRAALDVSDREARIAATKRELDAIAHSQIRELPPRPHAPPTRPGPMPDRR